MDCKNIDCIHCDENHQLNCDMWEDDDEVKGCWKYQTEQAEASSLSDLLSAVKVKKEKTLSGWEQPYVSVKIGNFEFKRLYHTEDGAVRCADKIKTLLTTGT